MFYWGLGIFFFVAILCIIAGYSVMKRRRTYEASEYGGEDPMSDAEFRRIEGFDD